MNTARLWGLEHSQTTTLPASLADVDNRADLVQAINETLAGRYMPTMSEPQKEAFLAEVLTVCNQHVTEDLSDDEKISVGLRVWSGCLAAAKTIAGETRDGPNTSGGREAIFQSIDVVAERDTLFSAGVETAPTWKRLIGQGNDIYFDGVSANSPVRRYQDSEPDTDWSIPGALSPSPGGRADSSSGPSRRRNTQVQSPVGPGSL